MSGPSLRDKAIAALAHHMNGSEHECENHLYRAAASVIDGLHAPTFHQLGIDLEEDDMTAHPEIRRNDLTGTIVMATGNDDRPWLILWSEFDHLGQWASDQAVANWTPLVAEQPAVQQPQEQLDNMRRKVKAVQRQNGQLSATIGATRAELARERERRRALENGVKGMGEFRARLARLQEDPGLSRADFDAMTQGLLAAAGIMPTVTQAAADQAQHDAEATTAGVVDPFNPPAVDPDANPFAAATPASNAHVAAAMYQNLVADQLGETHRRWVRDSDAPYGVRPMNEEEYREWLGQRTTELADELTQHFQDAGVLPPGTQFEYGEPEPVAPDTHVAAMWPYQPFVGSGCYTMANGIRVHYTHRCQCRGRRR